MSRILVTGGAGFMGSHAAEHLCGQGHEVTVLDDLSGGFKEVAKIMNVKPDIQYLEKRSEVDEAYSDHTKAVRVLAAGARFPLEEGLKRMAEWVKRHGARQSKAFEAIEIHKNLPPSWTEKK